MHVDIRLEPERGHQRARPASDFIDELIVVEESKAAVQKQRAPGWNIRASDRRRHEWFGVVADPSFRFEPFEM